MRDVVLGDRFSRVECPLKSVQYQFAPMFITVVFNPLAPGSGTGRAINLTGVPLCRAQDKISAGASRRNQFAWPLTLIDKFPVIIIIILSNFFHPLALPPGWPPNYRRRLWQTARALFESCPSPDPPQSDGLPASHAHRFSEQPIFIHIFLYFAPDNPPNRSLLRSSIECIFCATHGTTI
jgi:hypothetical protein